MEITAPPDGVIYDQYTSNNTDFTPSQGGWGCVNDEEPAYVYGCPGSQDEYNDWVYFEAPALCEVPVQFTITSGNTEVLQEACSS